ncbi:MBL fold metallo-hydrolase [Cereibacter azotoformans]|uniref:Hydroxyacylglutathione hydrolase n=1 Tax=Cereibacter azotoformans TaxID=43057 RepID=A0A2T5KCU4_9RHOB|nr:MBL fold metallo-hydrolase [Cereibacter azotoformans]AXQ93472.1 MBL fold metallo-hydrolase [Cereibacter sphaeroides]MBO4168765.1 MBL fold metallo-hydrolase [Cereibacter azotoformans]PTR20243.1 hydroxyacylglutathione hydrolase [Cereibacter azotoformans]UIJ31808.1 MBL fold metallo-hydrolase [Cereibacter azotoformans]
MERPEPGRCVTLEPGLRRVLAPNPSPMTHWGTNSYILGEGEVALIDPGPDHAAHREALLAALAPGERITTIFVTHAHRDHSPLARPLATLTGAEILAFGTAVAGRSPLMSAFAGELGGGEGVDDGFVPDRCLGDGERIAGPGWEIEAIHTPGHFGNHLCLAWGDRCFSGDHVMGWATSLVSPPDGDMGAYLSSLDRLGARPWRIFHPGHGAPVTRPADRIAWLAAHRREREASILRELSAEAAHLSALTARVYRDTPPALHPQASRNLLAHLLDLWHRGLVVATPGPSPEAVFAIAGPLAGGVVARSDRGPSF